MDLSHLNYLGRGKCMFALTLKSTLRIQPFYYTVGQFYGEI